MGNFITGTYLEEDDVVSAEASQLNGNDVYVYEVRTLQTSIANHNLSVDAHCNWLGWFAANIEQPGLASMCCRFEQHLLHMGCCPEHHMRLLCSLFH